MHFSWDQGLSGTEVAINKRFCSPVGHSKLPVLLWIFSSCTQSCCCDVLPSMRPIWSQTDVETLNLNIRDWVKDISRDFLWKVPSLRSFIILENRIPLSLCCFIVFILTRSSHFSGYEFSSCFLQNWSAWVLQEHSHARDWHNYLRFVSCDQRKLQMLSKVGSRYIKPLKRYNMF